MVHIVIALCAVNFVKPDCMVGCLIVDTCDNGAENTSIQRLCRIMNTFFYI